jgi:hypothetical protein
MWHIQHEAFNWCSCMLFFGWWPCLTSSHPLSKRFQQTFSMLSTITKSSNKHFGDFNLHTWTWMCLALTRVLSKVASASISTWVLIFDSIEEASFFSICHFNSFAIAH